jgi:hypothetical protein
MNPTVEQMRQELSERTPMSAVGRAAAGQAGANLIKSQPQIKASEALGQAMERGFKKTTTTQADRTKVGGGNIGGGAFSAISEAHPEYEGKVWGVMDPGTASRLTNLTDPETAWTTMLGSATQLKTNPIVFGKLRRAFLSAMKEGKLTPELEAKFNHNLALTFGEGANVRDPKIWDAINTFEKRAAMADLMMGQGIAPKKGGVAMGGEKSGKGVIFRPTDILKGETERSLMHSEHGGDVPTFAAGPRLFSLSGTHEQRPDLHPGFPTLLHGKDLNYNVKPTPTEIYLRDWHARFKAANPERYYPHKSQAQSGPGYYDLALGVKGEGLPSQALNDEYIRHLIREGYAEGGAVEPTHDEMLAHVMLHKAAGGAVQPDAPDGTSTDLGYYEGGPSDGAGMDPMQYHAAGGSIANTSRIGVDEAPDMPIKLYMPPDGHKGGMPIGGVDFQPQVPGQQMTPQQQAPQGAQAPQGMPPQGAAGQAPQGQPQGPQSNILSMTPQGQAMAAMKATPPAMKTGGAVKMTTAQMRMALLHKADGGAISAPSPLYDQDQNANGNGISSGSSGGISTPSLSSVPTLADSVSAATPTAAADYAPTAQPFSADGSMANTSPLGSMANTSPLTNPLTDQTTSPIAQPPAMKKGGRVGIKLTVEQMRMALRNKKAAGEFEPSKISDIGLTERPL